MTDDFAAETDRLANPDAPPETKRIRIPTSKTMWRRRTSISTMRTRTRKRTKRTTKTRLPRRKGKT